MTGHSLGSVMMFLGFAFFWICIGIHNQMQRLVARMAPPKTNRPLKNLGEALNSRRVWKEYRRLFPKRAERNALLIKLFVFVGVVCILLGIYLAR